MITTIFRLTFTFMMMTDLSLSVLYKKWAIALKIVNHIIINCRPINTLLMTHVIYAFVLGFEKLDFNY